MQYGKKHEIVVLSGKGGTGKTSLAASLAFLAQDIAVVADCDVEAANMHLLLQPDCQEKHDFFSGYLAAVDQEACTLCGTCEQICRFDAIAILENECMVNAVNCEGCGYCARICPANAIQMKPAQSGQIFISHNRLNTPMVHATLNIGAGNSGKLVAQVKDEAKTLAKQLNKAFIIVDGPPGIGCPVISSLSGADLVVLIAEPAAAGNHDLKRLVEVTKKFRINMMCIVNKHDINQEKTAELKIFLEQQNIPHLVDIPFDDVFTRAMTAGKTLVEMPSPLNDTINEAWTKIKTQCNNLMI
jgi:MinD superfamily P-loop ATPase